MDLETRAQVCLLAWAKRIILNPQGTAANITRAFCGEFFPELIWAAKHNFSARIAAVSPFYSEVLQVWHKFHNTPPQGEADIRRELLWNNPMIPSLSEHRSTLRWARWIHAGIWTVGQICHPTEDRLLGQQEIHNKYSIEPTFLEALAIRNYISIRWKRSLSQDFKGEDSVYYGMVINGQQFNLMASGPKGWYGAALLGERRVIQRQHSWIEELSPPGEQVQIDWEAMYKLSFQITRETKLQSFHYRLLHRLITCKKYLHTINISTDDKCVQCGARDTIVHFFATCPQVKAFWEKLSAWCLNNNLGFDLALLSEGEKVLGVLDCNGNRPRFKRINWIILTAKYYLHRQKLFHAGELSLIAFLAELRNKLLMEKQACHWARRPQKFEIWETLLKTLNP